MQIFTSRQFNDLAVDLIADCTGYDEAKLFSGMPHPANTGMSATRKNTDARLEHARQEVAGQVLQRQAHVGIINRVTLLRTDDCQWLRAIAEALDQKAEILIEGGREIDRVHEARS